MQLSKLDLTTPIIPAGADELHLAFVPGRGAPLRSSLHATHVAGRRGSQPNVVVFPLAQQLAGQAQQITIFTLGDMPTPALYAFRVGPNSIIAAPSDAQHTPGQTEFDFETVPNKQPDKVVFGPADYRQGLVDSLISEEEPVKTYRGYFCQLEQGSNPSLLPRNVPVRHHIEAVMPTLRRRARTRAVLFQREPARTLYPLLHQPTEALKESVQALSGMQLGLIETFFTKSGRFDLAAFEEAHELFANGHLRRKLIAPGLSLGYWVTQPSSAYYVFFAEFAFLAIECDVDAARWRKLVHVMTRTQTLYFRAYSPPPGTNHAGFGDYMAENFRASNQASSAAVLQLRATFGQRPIREVCFSAGQTAIMKMPRFAEL